VAGHAPFCWGSTPADAAHNAVILESVARMAWYTVSIAPQAKPLARELHDKHFLRKTRTHRILRTTPEREMKNAQ